MFSEVTSINKFYDWPFTVTKNSMTFIENKYEVWNFNSGNYLFTTDTK